MQVPTARASEQGLLDAVLCGPHARYTEQCAPASSQTLGESLEAERKFQKYLCPVNEESTETTQRQDGLELWPQKWMTRRGSVD